MVTGASRGIGRAVALMLAEEGCELALVARDAGRLESLAASCREKSGRRALVLPLDLMKNVACKKAVAACRAEFGGLDILVNNAGIAYPGGAVEADPMNWEEMILLNLMSVMRLSKAAIPEIIESPAGAIIFVSSISGKRAFGGAAGYCASKHGVNGFAEAIFEDLKPYGTKISAICPGWVNTGMAAQAGVDPELVMQPEDVAEAVRFVARFPSRGCPTEILLRCQHPGYL